DCIRRGRECLSRTQRKETSVAVGAYAYFQPARVPVEYAGAKVQCHSEQSIGNRHGGISQDGAYRVAAGERIIKNTAKIINAGGENAAGIQAALVSKGGA